MASKAGRLVALEGTSGPDVEATARKLVRALCDKPSEGGVSVWDSSNIFYELRKGDTKGLNPAPRTLLLLYAGDLAFRLRWEIQPALDEGLIVVAAPYVESAIAFGKALGISKRWLVELFSFAPRPHACYRLKEKKDAPEWKVKRSAGYLEFCCKTLLSAPPAWDAKKIRSRFIDYLDALEKRGSCRTLTEKTLGNS